MKKIIAVIMLIVLCSVMFVGCGNLSCGVGNYEFDKIHIDTHHYSGCLTIEKWYDNSTGVEVKTKEAGYLYLAEGMYILVEGECPFCTEQE